MVSRRKIRDAVSHALHGFYRVAFGSRSGTALLMSDRQLVVVDFDVRLLHSARVTRADRAVHSDNRDRHHGTNRSRPRLRRTREVCIGKASNPYVCRHEL